MPGGVYSTRFLAVAGLGGGHNYTVPGGRVAIVKCVTLAATDGAAHGAVVSAAGATITAAVLPAGGYQRQLDDLYVVVNGGEVIGCLSDAGGHVTVSGYLLTA